MQKSFEKGKIPMINFEIKKRLWKKFIFRALDDHDLAFLQDNLTIAFTELTQHFFGLTFNFYAQFKFGIRFHFVVLWFAFKCYLSLYCQRHCISWEKSPNSPFPCPFISLVLLVVACIVTYVCSKIKIQNHTQIFARQLNDANILKNFPLTTLQLLPSFPICHLISIAFTVHLYSICFNLFQFIATNMNIM